MSVRKRTWKNAAGEAKEAWVVDYIDQKGQRHIETFTHKKAATDRHAVVKVDVSKGVHTPLNQSITIAKAARDWLEYTDLEGRERSTVAQYRGHVERHIIPRIGNEKLAKLTMPRVNAFRDELVRDLSRPMAHKVLVSLKSIIKDARRRGNVSQNAADGVSIKADTRGEETLEAGTHFPRTDEISRILGAAKGRWRPFLAVAIFTGLRASELRGLRWVDVDLQAGEVNVRQRADRYGAIGSLKSKSGRRTVPIGPFVVNTLREWKLQCPKGELDLVFPNGVGNIEGHANIVDRGLIPTLTAAGIEGKYTGLHCLRHFYASWCINRKADGGLELPLKIVSARLGHASISITADVYGHLFPRTDDGSELAQAELRLLG